MSRKPSRRKLKRRELARKCEDSWTCLLGARVLCTTEAKILIELADEEYWLPKTQVAHPDDWKPGRSGNITVRTTLARQLNLIGSEPHFENPPGEPKKKRKTRRKRCFPPG